MNDNAPPSLEFATNDELIAELLRRDLFRGVLLWQPNYRANSETHEGAQPFRWEARHCDPVMVCGQAAQHLSGVLPMPPPGPARPGVPPPGFWKGFAALLFLTSATISMLLSLTFLFLKAFGLL